MFQNMAFVSLFLLACGCLIGRFGAGAYGMGSKVVRLGVGSLVLMIIVILLGGQRAKLPPSYEICAAAGLVLGILSVPAGPILWKRWYAPQLEFVRHAQSSESLIPYLSSRELEVRREAIATLGRIGDPTAVTILSRQLTGGWGGAAAALGQIASPEAIEVLLVTIEKRQRRVMEYGAEALGVLYCSGRLSDAQRARLEALSSVQVTSITRPLYIDSDGQPQGAYDEPVYVGNYLGRAV